LLVPVSASPGFHAINDLPQNHRGREVLLIKNQGIASFPDLPKGEQDHIQMNRVRKLELLPKNPGKSEFLRPGLNPNLCPELLSRGAKDEDVCISFQDARAAFTVGLLKGLDVTVKERGSRV
jgi:hypothetical protein